MKKNSNRNNNDKQPVQNTLKEEKYRKQYRSNLKKIISFLADVNLRECHLELLKTTPFYHFLLPFIKNEVVAAYVIGMQGGVCDILSTFNKENEGFFIGGKKLTIYPAEFDLIFGIASGHKKVDTKGCSMTDCSLAQRKFAEFLTVKPAHLKTRILEFVVKTEQIEVEDTVRIIILHVLSCVFFVASSEVARMWMLKLCDKIDELRDYNCGATVVDFLMNYLRDGSADAVRGCTAFIKVIRITQHPC